MDAFKKLGSSRLRALTLLGLGECMVEISAAEPLAEAECLRRSYGGDVLNSLVVASRLGSRCGFISKVGDDPFGAWLRRSWQQEGIDLSFCPLVPGTNGVYFISLDASGEREFSYRRAGSAASTLAAAAIDEAYVAHARILLLSGITQAISAAAQEATLGAARLAQAQGVVVAFDPNTRPRLWAARGGVAAAKAAFAELLPYIDILLPSLPADEVILEAPERSLAAGMRALLEAGVELIALKCGANGCQIFSQQTPTGAVIAAAEATRVVDTTGAGDTFNGSFLHFLAADADVLSAAQQANAQAAASLAHRGALAQP